MTAPRRNNVVAILGERSPELIGWLEIPLTPSRAARLSDFCARQGVDAQTLVTDLLDDVIFSTSHAVLPAPPRDRSSLREGHGD